MGYKCRALDTDFELCGRPCAAGEFFCPEHIAEREEDGVIIYLPIWTKIQYGEIIGGDFYASDECVGDTGYDPTRSARASGAPRGSPYPSPWRLRSLHVRRAAGETSASPAMRSTAQSRRWDSAGRSRRRTHEHGLAFPPLSRWEANALVRGCLA